MVQNLIRRVCFGAAASQLACRLSLARDWHVDKVAFKVENLAPQVSEIVAAPARLLAWANFSLLVDAIGP